MTKMLQKLNPGVWTRSLIMFAVVVFLTRFGQGLLGGARMVFFVDTLKLSGGQVLWLEGIRELPGLALIFVAALTMRMPLKRQAAVVRCADGRRLCLVCLCRLLCGLVGGGDRGQLWLSPVDAAEQRDRHVVERQREHRAGAGHAGLGGFFGRNRRDGRALCDLVAVRVDAAAVLLPGGRHCDRPGGGFLAAASRPIWA